MKSPRFAIENVLLHLSEHFTYLNSGEDKGVQIIKGLLYFVYKTPVAEYQKFVEVYCHKNRHNGNLVTPLVLVNCQEPIF